MPSTLNSWKKSDLLIFHGTQLSATTCQNQYVPEIACEPGENNLCFSNKSILVGRNLNLKRVIINDKVPSKCFDKNDLRPYMFALRVVKVPPHACISIECCWRSLASITLRTYPHSFPHVLLFRKRSRMMKPFTRCQPSFWIVDRCCSHPLLLSQETVHQFYNCWVCTLLINYLRYMKERRCVMANSTKLPHLLNG